MSLLCTAGGALCLLYVFVIVCYAGVHVDFSWIWLAAGIVLIGWGRLCAGGFAERIPGWIRMIAGGLLGAGTLLFCVLLVWVLQGRRAAPYKGERKLPYVIVLGAQVRGRVPSKALRQRLETAAAYAKDHPDTTLILSGGQGPGEEIPEAVCMREYLAAADLPEERLILETHSTSTRENLRFSDELTGCAGRAVGLISNGFHMTRALQIAKSQGYSEAVGIPAATDALLEPHFVVREVFALAKEFVFHF